MRNGLTTAAFAVILLLSSRAEAQTGTGSPGSAVEQELIALDKKFDESRRKGETSAVADVLADDFVQVIGTDVRTKADVLKAVASAQPIPPGLAEPPAPTYTVRVHGDTAILTHVTRWTDPHTPALGSGVMHVFVKQQGRWKMAGWSSVLAPPTTEQSINRAGYELMQSGKVLTGENRGAGWVDTTDESVKRAKARLVELESLLTEKGSATISKP